MTDSTLALMIDMPLMVDRSLVKNGTIPPPHQNHLPIPGLSAVTDYQLKRSRGDVVVLGWHREATDAVLGVELFGYFLLV